MNIRTLIAPAAAGGVIALGLGAGLAVAAAPDAAEAHDQAFDVTCTSLSVNLTNYPHGSTIGGTLDGVDLGTTTFGPSFSQSSVLDPAVAHTWSISVVSGDGDHRYDKTFAGASDPACIPTISTPPVVVPPTDEPTTPPVTTPPTEEPTTPPTTPPVVVTTLPVPVQECVNGKTSVTIPTGNDEFWVYPKLHDGPDPHLSIQFLAQPGYVLAEGSVDLYRFDVPGAACPIPPTDEPTTPVTPPVDEPTDEPTAPEATLPPVVTPTTPAATPTTTPVTITATETATPVATSIDDSGSLAYTGTSPWVYALGALGLAMLALGGVLVARRRQVTAEADSQ